MKRPWWRLGWIQLVAVGTIIGVVLIAVLVGGLGSGDDPTEAAPPAAPTNVTGCPVESPDPNIGLATTTSCTYREFVIKQCQYDEQTVPQEATVIADGTGAWVLKFDLKPGFGQVSWIPSNGAVLVQCSNSGTPAALLRGDVVPTIFGPTTPQAETYWNGTWGPTGVTP